MLTLIHGNFGPSSGIRIFFFYRIEFPNHCSYETGLVLFITPCLDDAAAALLDLIVGFLFFKYFVVSGFTVFVGK